MATHFGEKPRIKNTKAIKKIQPDAKNQDTTSSEWILNNPIFQKWLKEKYLVDVRNFDTRGLPKIKKEFMEFVEKSKKELMKNRINAI